MRSQPVLRSFALAAAAIATAATAAHAAAEAVVVYTTSQIQLTNVPPGARVIELDRLRRLEAHISHGLPANPQEAARLIQQRMNKPEWNAIEGQLHAAAEGVAQARAAGIRKVPAVTVDDAYVVYGIGNVAAAVEQIQRARQPR